MTEQLFVKLQKWQSPFWKPLHFYFYFEKVAFGKKVVYNVGADSGKK